MNDTIIGPRINIVEMNESYGKFVVEPLARGYATTLGNAMRRVMLSSVPGASVSAIQIEGVFHEFSTLPGVKEDTTELILNLKDVSVKSYRQLEPNESVILELDVQGEGVVTAADIRCPEDIEIVNPEVYLCTLSGENARLQMQIHVQTGIGYVLPDKVTLPANIQNTIGVIPIGAHFSPVVKVNHIVESTRVGFQTDLERLTIEVWTNNTITPIEVVRTAANVLISAFSLFTKLGESRDLQTVPGLENVPEIPLQQLGFTSRTQNCLSRAQCSTLRDLVCLSQTDLMGIRNFGEKSLREVREVLYQRGLTLRGDNLENVRKELFASGGSDVPIGLDTSAGQGQTEPMQTDDQAVSAGASPAEASVAEGAVDDQTDGPETSKD